MNDYFYHCTINTADILISGKLSTAFSMGFRNVSLFRHTIQTPVVEMSKYYKAPDNKDPRRFGESVFPIKSAFCFSPDIKQDVSPAYRNRQGFDSDAGLVKKGMKEYLYPGDLNVINNPRLSGIRIPQAESEAADSYLRLIALLYLRNANIKVANGNNNFADASGQFHLVREKLGGFIPSPTIQLTKEKLVEIDMLLFGNVGSRCFPCFG